MQKKHFIKFKKGKVSIFCHALAMNKYLRVNKNVKKNGIVEVPEHKNILKALQYSIIYNPMVQQPTEG